MELICTKQRGEVEKSMANVKDWDIYTNGGKTYTASNDKEFVVCRDNRVLAEIKKERNDYISITVNGTEIIIDDIQKSITVLSK